VRTTDQRRLLALCAVRIGDQTLNWNLVARQASSSQGLDLLYAGEVVEQTRAAVDTRLLLAKGLEDLAQWDRRVAAELELADEAGARLVTVLDDDYPANLRLIKDLPPFLFVRGTLDAAADARSVAVVGTRNATPDGLVLAAKMATLLSERHVTVASGLARGIDTAAHTAALDAGARTVAVIGTGIAAPAYPKENADLAERIAATGAVVSQFWPSNRPATWTFPQRNAVMSGITQGTVVIEASKTSGAKMQARLALAQGKRAWLIRSLVTDQPWARSYVDERGAVEVDGVDDVISDLAEPDRLLAVSRQRRELTLL